MSYSTTGTSVAPAVSIPPLDELHPEQWIHNVWNDYVELWTYLLGLQHEAATIAAQTASDPNGVVHTTAKAVVSGCAQLMNIQRQVQAKVETYSAALGLGQAVVGPVAGFAAVAIAGIIVWSFNRYMALRAALDAVQTGGVTSDQAAQLLNAAGSAPSLDVLGGVSTGLVVGALAVVGLFWWLGRRRENPYLIPLGANPQPEETWSKRVLSLDYVHDDDGQAYTHSFRPGVRMQALEDGSVRLYNPRKRIWREF